MRGHHFCFLLFLLFFWTVTLSLQAAVPGSLRLVQGQKESILYLNELWYIEDSTQSLSFEEVRQQPGLFHQNPDFKPADYNPRSAYWVKLKLNFDDAANTHWLLEFYDQSIDFLEAYLPNGKGGYTLTRMGDARPFHEKGFKHKNFVFLLSQGLQGEQTCYFRVQSHTYADIRIAIRSVNRFVQYALAEYFLYGIFYGTILIISLYNVLVFLAIGERKYLFYTAYLLSVGLYAMALDGIAFQYLWPGATQWNQYAAGIALFLLIAWSILFAQRFLNTAVRAPRFHKLLNLMLLLRTAWFLFAFFWNKDLLELRNIEIMPLSLIFTTGIWVLLRGYKPARFFVLAYGFLFLGFLMKALVQLSVIPFGITTYYSLHISFLLEMLFLTFALSDRVRILKDLRDRVLKRALKQQQENAALKDKVNRELEERIRQRTHQLEEKNQQLEELNQKLYKQTNEIGRINSMLDLDNWKLKNNIKEILQDRLINKSLSPEQFYKVFNNQESCYRFLEKLKWQEGFACSKCSHGSYTQGQLPYSRRCTRCGYDESVTSHTVFHGIKFPLEKAFYILYLTSNSQEAHTLDELSAMVKLRRGTVWNFKKKVQSTYRTTHENPAASLMQKVFQ